MLQEELQHYQNYCDATFPMLLTNVAQMTLPFQRRPHY
jgi:hypothetical protein